PLESELQRSSASCHDRVPNGLPSFSQISPVKLSVTVPLLLSLKRGSGQGTPPARVSPSCPEPEQSISTARRICMSIFQHFVCPVLATRSLLPRTGHIRMRLNFRSKTGGPTAMATYQPNSGKAATEVDDQ